MTVKEKIFEELKKENFTEGSLWRVTHYLNSFLIHLTCEERKEFYTVMNELCDEGLFINQEGNYRLTGKGEIALRRNGK